MGLPFRCCKRLALPPLKLRSIFARARLLPRSREIVECNALGRYFEFARKRFPSLLLNWQKGVPVVRIVADVPLGTVCAVSYF